MRIDLEDKSLVTFRSDLHKMSAEECQDRVDKRMKVENTEEKDDIMIQSVNVRLMDLKWLKRRGLNFLGVVEILTQKQNEVIQPTEFTSSLLDGFWDIYFYKLLYTQFFPFILYLSSMIYFQVYTLIELDGDETTPAQDMFYFILLGMTFIFFVNQVKCEIVQF